MKMHGELVIDDLWWIVMTVVFYKGLTQCFNRVPYPYTMKVDAVDLQLFVSCLGCTL